MTKSARLLTKNEKNLILLLCKTMNATLYIGDKLNIDGLMSKIVDLNQVSWEALGDLTRDIPFFDWINLMEWILREWRQESIVISKDILSNGKTEVEENLILLICHVMQKVFKIAEEFNNNDLTFKIVGLGQVIDEELREIEKEYMEKKR